MVETPFCEWQIYGKYKDKQHCLIVGCSPDDTDSKLTCSAHLAEGRTFPCPYKPEQIYIDNYNRKPAIAFRNSSRAIEGVCEDFEPPKQTSQAATSQP